MSIPMASPNNRFFNEFVLPYKSCILPSILLWFNLIFALLCYAIPSKSTSFSVLTSFRFNLLSPKYLRIRFKAALQFFFALDFVHHEYVCCIWQDISRHKVYHQRFLQHKYNVYFLANMAVVYSPLMAHLTLPALFEHA